MTIPTWTYWLLVGLLSFSTVLNLINLGKEKLSTENHSPRMSYVFTVVLNLVLLYGLLR